MNITPTNGTNATPRRRRTATPYAPGPYIAPVPEIGKATAHLELLRRHLLTLGHPAEASAVSTALDLLIPSRRFLRDVAWPPR